MSDLFILYHKTGLPLVEAEEEIINFFSPALNKPESSSVFNINVFFNTRRLMAMLILFAFISFGVGIVFSCKQLQVAGCRLQQQMQTV
jgi:hypothetical protein